MTNWPYFAFTKLFSVYLFLYNIILPLSGTSLFVWLLIFKMLSSHNIYFSFTTLLSLYLFFYKISITPSPSLGNFSLSDYLFLRCLALINFNNLTVKIYLYWMLFSVWKYSIHLAIHVQSSYPHPILVSLFYSLFLSLQRRSIQLCGHTCLCTIWVYTLLEVHA